MKKFILLIVGVIFSGNLAFSQQKNPAKKDSTSFKSHQFSKLKFSDSTDSTAFRKHTTNSKNQKMPIFIPKGDHRIRIHEIDTTINFSLRIIEPDNCGGN